LSSSAHDYRTFAAWRRARDRDPETYSDHRWQRPPPRREEVNPRHPSRSPEPRGALARCHFAGDSGDRDRLGQRSSSGRGASPRSAARRTQGLLLACRAAVLGVPRVTVSAPLEAAAGRTPWPRAGVPAVSKWSNWSKWFKRVRLDGDSVSLLLFHLRRGNRKHWPAMAISRATWPPRSCTMANRVLDRIGCVAVSFRLDRTLLTYEVAVARLLSCLSASGRSNRILPVEVISRDAR
jgi:hypothetical protein